MPESTSASRDNSAKAILARLEGHTSIPAHSKEKVTDLPRWVKTALVMREVDGLTYKEAAGRFSKAGGTLSEYAKSPAAKIWLSHLADFVEDPVAMAKAYLSANALSVTLDRLAFLQAAIDAGDYATGDKIAKDLQDRMGIGVKKTNDGAISVRIHMGGGTAGLLESPSVEAEWEVVDDGSDDDDG